jgi:glycerophosphoryl diester phosphodiesterase
LIGILAHRGHWDKAEERNGRAALQRAFANGFGVETDVRDCSGKLVISHDMPSGDEMSLQDFLALVPRDVPAESLPLALNIKADGLASDIAAAMRGRPAGSWFAFDMSVPDLLAYARAGLPVFTRVSDYEAEPTALAESCGIWVDGFDRDWEDVRRLHAFLDAGKRVALVSPELHKRPYQDFWNAIRSDGIWRRPEVLICTDFPVQATTFFRD